MSGAQANLCRFNINNSCGLMMADRSEMPKACDTCRSYSGPARGAGDVVHSIAKATGIAAAVETVMGKDCGCQGRRSALNRMIPFAGDDPRAS